MATLEKRLIDLAQRGESHHYLCCQLMSGVYLSKHYKVGEQGGTVWVGGGWKFTSDQIEMMG